ncbi:MAG TPA: TPM domain-containing protein [Caulobacteraceae bacterium]|nr:TPM domain-containing protein [Caulobacteraceae bacterium]
MAPPAFADPKFPELTGRVVDDAHVLKPETKAALEAKLQALEEKTTRQLVVVTLPDLQGYAVEDYGYQLLRHWGIGQKATNNGALFIVAPSERKVRIEVGYGLEGVLTDALSSVILQRAVLPKFRAGDVEGGVVAGTDAIIEQLSLDAPQAQARVAQAAKPPARHGGNPLGGIIPLIVIFFILASIFRGGRRGGGALGWILPALILSSASRRGGGWGGGSSWGGGGGDWGGGGGFSGGGGSGGGGGASGSW